MNAVTAASVHNLFARNERHISYFDTPRGPMAMVLVGAMIVAGIETVWAGQVAPARGDSGAGAARARRGDGALFSRPLCLTIQRVTYR